MSGAALGRFGFWYLAVAPALALALIAVRRRAVWLAVPLLVAATMSGHSAHVRQQLIAEAWLPSGTVHLAGTAVTDVQPSPNGDWVLFEPEAIFAGDRRASWSGPVLLLSGVDEVAARELMDIRGRMVDRSGVARGRTFAAVVEITAQSNTQAPNALWRLANDARRRIFKTVQPWQSPQSALLSGFLVGDIRWIPQEDVEAMRLAGLSHFTAVSGSNVALFLVLWWFMLGPLGIGPWARALLGSAGLLLFATITRWEPSVVRASAMAALLLAGRAVGIPLSAWSALGIAVTLGVLVSGDLVTSVGFQLSVAATAGVLAGARLLSCRPRWLATVVSVTLSAQAAVAPLLLWHFEQVPIAAPLTNVASAPLVATATVLGAVGGLMGMEPVTAIGAALANVVLWIARLGADLPQLSRAGAVGLVLVLPALAWPAGRRLAAVGGVAALAATVSMPGLALVAPGVTFLDIGQGDAALIIGEQGEAVLVDTGPDPDLLARKLSEYGVERLDLVILSHEHADHTAGLAGIAADLELGTVWYPERAGESLVQLTAVMETAGVTVAVPDSGSTHVVGSVRIEVLGPVRKYASPNDESLVVRVWIGETAILLPGDVERVAQADLAGFEADVLKVPHQGSATSDLAWLASVGARVAVISVGPNTFGHPSEEVIRALGEEGARVLRTDLAGDVTIELP